MIDQVEILLVATAALPIAGTAGTFLTQSFGREKWGIALARAGVFGGALLGTVLATILAGRDHDASTIELTLLNWFTFSLPNAPSISFGLEATPIKAGLVGITGALACIALWNRGSNQSKPISDDSVLMISLLYAGGIWFVFAPNLAQSLSGWALISLSAGILIRLSHLTIVAGDEFAVSVTDNDQRIRHPHSPLRTFSTIIHGVEWAAEQAQIAAIHTIPNWVAEQAELLETGSVSLQLLAVLLGTSAILLTWLMNPFR